MSSAVGLVLLWVWILLDSGASSASLPETTDSRFIEECVGEHNKARSSVSPPARNMLYMTWDEGLSLIAKAWAEQCVSRHNPKLKDDPSVHPDFPSVGENIWTGSPSLFDVKRALKKWVDEKDDYNYKGNKCSSVCGHYTQVVWGSSYKVGCAAHLCPGGVAGFPHPGAAVVFVCNYATAGNVNSQRPYESGSCSGCGGSCVDRLCHDNLSPQGSPAVASTYPGYVNILIVRPIGLLLTFITAYALHYCYPDVFFYE